MLPCAVIRVHVSLSSSDTYSMATEGIMFQVQTHESSKRPEDALPVYTGGTGLVVAPVDGVQTSGLVEEKPGFEPASSEPVATQPENDNSFEGLSMILVSPLLRGIFMRLFDFGIRVILRSRCVKVCHQRRLAKVALTSQYRHMDCVLHRHGCAPKPSAIYQLDYLTMEGIPSIHVGVISSSSRCTTKLILQVSLWSAPYYSQPGRLGTSSRDILGLWLG